MHGEDNERWNDSASVEFSVKANTISAREEVAGYSSVWKKVLYLN